MLKLVVYRSSHILLLRKSIISFLFFFLDT